MGFKKITKEQIKEIKRLKKIGVPIYKIAKQVGCCDVTVNNYTSKKSREQHRTYQRERYQNDEEFRKKVIACNIKNQTKYRKEGRAWKDLHPIIYIKWRKAYDKKYSEEHKEEKDEYAKNYRKEHREELRLKHLEYSRSPKGIKCRKRYFRKNKDKIDINHKKWYLENKDKIAKIQREYQKNNKEKVNAYNRKIYQKNKKKMCKRKRELYNLKNK